MTFEYRDDSRQILRINAVEPDYPGQRIIPGIWIDVSDGGFNRAYARVPIDRVEELVAGIRDAARQANGQQPDAHCMCGHLRSQHLTVSGRLLCNECESVDACREYTPIGVQDATQPTTDETVILPPTTQLSYRIEHRREGESTWRQGRPGTGLRWTYAEREKADQRLAEARAQWPQYEHRMVTITTTVTEAVAAGAES
jgi:hypothetical protein